MDPNVHCNTVYNSQNMLLLSCFSRVRLPATHRWQPTRLLCPWDSPGKNIGVGCHFLLQDMEATQMSTDKGTDKEDVVI